MITLFVISIILGSVLYILWPVWHTGQTFAISPNANNGQVEELFDQRDNLLAVIKDLELEHQMGKISSEDFEALQNNYRAKAIQVLENIDQIDREMVTSRETIRESTNNGDHLESIDEKYCRNCGAVAETEDQFCTHCGNNLS